MGTVENGQFNLNAILYRMNHTISSWDDICEGTISCRYSKTGLSFIATTYQGPWEIKVPNGTACQMEGDAILWQITRKDCGLCEFVLRFDSKEGCMEIWKNIHLNENGKILPNWKEGSSLADQHDEDQVIEMFPECTMKNINRIALVIRNSALLLQRKDVIDALLKQDFFYIRMIINLSNESSFSEQGRHALFLIFKGILELNSMEITQLLLSDEYFLAVVGILENQSQEKTYQIYLKEKMHHKEIVPITNDIVLKKVHHNFRLDVFHDLLSGHLNEDTKTKLQTLSYYNRVYILRNLTHNQEYLSGIEKVIRNEDTREDGLALLLELCLLARIIHKQMPQPITVPDEFFHKVCEKDGFLQTLSRVLRDKRYSLCSMALQIIEIIFEHNSIYITNHIKNCNSHPRSQPRLVLQTSLKRKNNLLFGIILCVLSITNDSIAQQATELLTNILSIGFAEDPIFSSKFFRYYAPWMAFPLLSLENIEMLKRNSVTTLELVLKLLSNCVIFHGNDAAQFIISRSFLSIVVHCLDINSTFIHLAIIRFIRTCLGAPEHPLYLMELRNCGAFNKILTLFHINYPKTNLLTSTILDLLNFILYEVNSPELSRSICVDNYLLMQKLKKDVSIVKELLKTSLENWNDQEQIENHSQMGEKEKWNETSKIDEIECDENRQVELDQSEQQLSSTTPTTTPTTTTTNTEDHSSNSIVYQLSRNKRIPSDIRCGSKDVKRTRIKRELSHGREPSMKEEWALRAQVL